MLFDFCLTIIVSTTFVFVVQTSAWLILVKIRLMSISSNVILLKTLPFSSFRLGTILMDTRSRTTKCIPTSVDMVCRGFSPGRQVQNSVHTFKLKMCILKLLTSPSLQLFNPSVNIKEIQIIVIHSRTEKHLIKYYKIVYLLKCKFKNRLVYMTTKYRQWQILAKIYDLKKEKAINIYRYI